MYSSYSAAAFALRAGKPSYNSHSSFYNSSHHCQQYDGDGGQRELVPLNPHLNPRFLLDGYLLRHSTHLLLLSARLRPPPPPYPPHCCHRRAAARCCCCSGGGGGSAIPSLHHVPWRLEATAHRCCGQGTGRSDLGVVCQRLKERGCGCGSAGSARLGIRNSCGNRGTPRLLGRAVRQEVWEYDGGEWPHRSCSIECHDDWDEEEDDDQCGLAQWELPAKSRLRRRWKEEEDDDRCRDCRGRKGAENRYYDECEYSGHRREIRDVNGTHGSLRSARRRLEQRGYLDDEDRRRRREVTEERDRREFEFDDARRVGARRYSEDDRKYDRRRERRDSDYEDAFDARRVRADRYTEDDRKYDRRTERMDFEIDNENGVRRDGRHHRDGDERFVITDHGREKYREGDVSLLRSRRRYDDECDNDDQSIAERKHYSRGRSQSSASAFHKDASQRASSSRNTADERLARENSSSRVRRDDNVDRRAAQTSEERDQRYSSFVGLSNDDKNEYDYDEARLARVRDSRMGTHDVKVITEDDTNLISSSKNSSILKHRRDVDQQVTAQRDESKKSSQRIMETSEVRRNNSELDSAILTNHQEDRRNFIDNNSSSLQSSVKIASDSRRQIDQHDEVEVDQQVVTLTDSRKNSEKLTDIKMDSSHNVSRSSHSQRNYEEVNQLDIDDRSTSIENITHITRDKKRYINQQVIHETDIDVQNVTHADVSTVRASDISISRSSQNHSETRISDDRNITNLGIESSGEASTINLDMEGRGTILGRTGTTARQSIPGDSSARKSVNESVLESAARLEKSSTFHVGQFVGELQREASDADTTVTKKNEKSIMEGTTRSSSRSRMKGPSDEIWDVQSATSQETFKTADKDEGSSADGGANSASQTPKNETAIARKVHKSLWAYVADIVRLGWIQRGESHDSSNKSFKKSSSSNSQSTEGWLSTQGHDNDNIQKRNWHIKPNDHQLVKSHSAESESIEASTPKDKSLPTGTQGLQTSTSGNVSEVGISKGDLLPRISKGDVLISGERAKQSEVGASPKGNTMGYSAEDIISTSVDVTIGQALEDEVASSSRVTSQGSAEINAGKGISDGTSSMTTKAEEAGRIDGSDSWRYGPPVAITPYHIPQTQTMVPHEHTSSASFESTELPTGGSTRTEEKIFVRKAPEFTRTEGKDAELNRRKIQRNKQVLKGTFEDWEEAYQHDAKQRKTDELFMREALLEAQRAADIWEVPVGAVLVHNGEIIARGCNLVEDLRDSTAHAEIVCIREASSKLKTWRLADTTLYVTLEPCAMCAGAILQARVDTVVWGAPNKLLGADGSWVRLFPGEGQTSTLDPANQNQTAGPVHPFHLKIIVRRGVLSTECSEVMQQFFQLRRKKKQRPESPPRARLFGHHHHPIKFFTKVHHMFGAVFCL